MNLHDKSLAISLDTGTHKVPGDGLKNACSVLLLPFICCDNYIISAHVYKMVGTDFTFCSQIPVSLPH